MAAFGWSVGDLVSATRVTYRIGRALRETDGAASDYRETVAFLNCLAVTLERLGSLNDIFVRLEDVRAIQAQVDLVREPVQEFTRNIEQTFEPNLGSQAATGNFMRRVIV